jgi:hypothetical protein
MSSRFYWQWREPYEMFTLALLPRLRLTIGSSIGVGFAWFTLWLHVWLRHSRAPHSTTMIELLPHVWFHWNREWGYGVHLWFLRWKWHWWLHRKSPRAENGTL